MTPAAALALVIAAIGVLVVALALLTVARRWSNRRREARRLAAAEPLRPLLLALVAGEPDESQAAATELVALDRARWRAVEPDLEAMLVKVRGETHESVVRVLERRGSLARALHRLTSRDPVRRARGAELLGACRREGAADDLVEMLADPDPEVRTVAARALGRIGSARAALPLLATIGTRADVPPRIVATALLRIGVTAHPALVTAMADAEPLRRATAAEIAGLDGAVTAVDGLLRLLEHDPAVEVRIRAARALGRIGMPRSTPALLDATADDRPAALRTVAARALGDLGDGSAVPRLTELAGGPDHRVASNAAGSLLRSGAAGLAALAALADDVVRGAHAREALATGRLRGLVP
jgi:HEAT repeat protein